MGDRRLAGEEFTRVFPGYLTPTAAPATFNALCHVLQHRVIPGAVLSHTTAAVLLGIPLPYWIDDGVGLLSTASAGAELPQSTIPSVRSPEVWATDPLRRFPPLHCRVSTTSRVSAGSGVRVHRGSAEPDTMRIGRLTVAHPLDVLVDLAPMLAERDLVVAVDAVIGPRDPRTRIGQLLSADRWTADDIHTLLARRAGRRGISRLRRALERARPGVESPGETLTRLLLVDAGFPEPVVNLTVTDPITGGERRIDLAYPDLRLACEYDGDVHRVERGRWRADESRRANLAAAGWHLCRLTGGDLRRPGGFLERMRIAMTRAGAAVPSSTAWRGLDGLALGWGP